MDPGSAAHHFVLRSARGTTLTGNHGTFETNPRSTTAETIGGSAAED
jgi:hypothetical protein